MRFACAPRSRFSRSDVFKLIPMYASGERDPYPHLPPMKTIPFVSPKYYLRVKHSSHSQEILPNQGFALVIALSLMAFVLLLLLSITTLVRVETSVAKQSKEQLLARQNALLGLQLAVGRLQVAAGPDKRVTSTGELVANSDSSLEHHTVVWDATDPTATAPMDWLVSSTDPSNFDPAQTPDTTWPLLVSERDSGLVAEVRAEPLQIQGDRSTSGECAWWVGDEGVKARFDMAEPEALYNSVEQLDRLRVAGRWGIESLAAMGTDYIYDDPDFRSGLERIASREQFSVLNSSFETVLTDNFHDISATSRSLLTDVKHGGLKQDLSYLLDGGPGSPTGAIIVGTNLDPQFKRVTWEQMASFNGLAQEASTGAVQSRGHTESQYGVAPLLSMLKLNFGLTLKNQGSFDASPTSTQLPSERNYQIHHQIRPWFVLSNPYNVTLRAENYRIRFDVDDEMKIELSVDEGPNAGQIIAYEADMRDFLGNMVFTVPEVNLAPGQSKLYGLDYNDYPAYDYSFQYGLAGGEDYYVFFNVGSANSNPEKQFIFVENARGTPLDSPNAEPFDLGNSTIRINPGITQTGDVLEITDSSLNATWGGKTKQRIAKLAWQFSQGANLYVRTYVNGIPELTSNTLPADEELVQHIGPSLCGVAKSVTALGYWPVNPAFLPRSTSRFNGLYQNGSQDFSSIVNASTNAPTSQWAQMNINPSASSIFLNLLSAANTTANADTFTTNDGWATDINLRGKRLASLATDVPYQESWNKGMYRLTTQNHGAWVYAGLIDDASENLALGQYGFPWGAGVSYQGDRPTGLPRQVMLFDLPRQDATTGESYLTSLGQLQHFDASGYTEWDDGDDPLDTIDDASLAYTPTFTIGSSYASPFVSREDFSSRTDDDRQLVDWSYVLNDILFDSYFFSGYAPSSAANPDSLQNGRLQRMDASTDLSALPDAATATAEALYVDGGFNVNSTSVDAWYAVLSSFRGVEFGDVAAADTRGVFPRSLYQDPTSVETVALSDEDIQDTWKGWRHLQSDDTDQAASQLYQLAEAIVDEVKARGPFLSMSDFVNRKLVDDADPLAHQGLSGPLQAALDRVVNVDIAQIEEYEVDAANADRHYIYSSSDGDDSLQQHLGTGSIYESDGSTIAGTEASSAASVPGWVLQGDLLQSLAPVLSSRSDTFTIRSYGSYQDPVTGEIRSESYIEATVQRIPEYIDDVDTADTPTADLEGAANLLAGRKFEIVQYRFLEPSEI